MEVAMSQRLQRLLRRPATAAANFFGVTDLVRSTAAAVTEEGRHTTAQFVPYRRAQSYALVRPAAGTQTGTGLPVPPEDLWLGYAVTLDGYLAGGKEDMQKLLDLARASGFELHAGDRVLDFGCASGRLIRWFEDHATRAEVWGVDVSGPHIAWCQQHLDPPFRFATTTTCPHLPFEDNYFRLVYAASVFTHISDLAEAWLLELKRILRAGGRLILTIHDKHTIDLIRDPSWAAAHASADASGHVDEDFRALLLQPEHRAILGEDFAMATIGRGLVSQVFHDVEYVRRHWARYLDVHSVTPEAHGYQTAVVLEKRPY
jgi:SAM-dependent methyltransferase